MIFSCVRLRPTRHVLYGRYERSFRIPEGVDPAEVTADFAEGVLKVRMPKGKAKEPEAHHIEVK